MRKDNDHYELLPKTTDNYIRLELNYAKLKEYRKNQIKLLNKEIKGLDDKLSDI